MYQTLHVELTCVFVKQSLFQKDILSLKVQEKKQSNLSKNQNKPVNI